MTLFSYCPNVQSFPVYLFPESEVFGFPSNSILSSVIVTFICRYISDTGNNVIRVVDATTRIITTLAGMATGGSTSDGYMAINAKMTVPRLIFHRASDNALYVAANNDHNIRRIQLGPNAVPPVGFMTVVAGVAGATGSSGNGGPAASAKLCGNAGVAFDILGNMFIADQVG